MPWLAAAAVAAPIVGGLVGNVMAQGDRSAAKKAMKQALSELKAAGLPPDLSKEIIYKEFASAGILTPQLEEDIELAQSEFNNIQEDSSLRETQLEALNKFKAQAHGGMQGDERAALNQIRQSVGQDTRAKQQQILADQQRRGMGGSGNELIAQLQANQSGAQQAASQGDELMALIAQRVRQGTQDMSNAAQNVRAQDYQVASDRAQALDARNQFLHQNSTARQQRNVDRTNDAQASNLSNAQRLSEMNTNLANQEKLRQVNEQGSYYDRKMNRAQALSNAYLGQASASNAAADRTAQMYSGIGAGVGQGVAGYAANKQNTAVSTANMTPEQRAYYEKNK